MKSAVASTNCYHRAACRRASILRAGRHDGQRGGRGFTLLEVLVSIVVLSFGVLGVVGLQAASLQANKEARYQSAAVRLARELADLMRGNKATAILTTYPANPYLVGDLPLTASIPPVPTDCTTATCSPVDVAKFQMSDWLFRVRSELPGARVTVCLDDHPYAAGLPRWTCGTSAYNVIVVKIGWSRQSTNRSAAAASAIEQATDASVNPLVLLPVTPGY